MIGMPLAMLLRNAGVAALTTCHRISYKETLMDTQKEQRAEGRAAADACGPSVPGERPAIPRHVLLKSRKSAKA